jgi:plasmid stabilization system protein ParE
MPRLNWSPPALKDVQRLYRFLATKNPDAAKRAVRQIRAGVRILAHQPQAGRPTVGTDAEFREWFIEFGSSGYVALYRMDRGTVVIVAVKHGRENAYLPDQPE